MRKIKTKKKEIIEYYNKTLSDFDLGVDVADIANRCWRCAYERRLERCHIIPHSLGGKDIPSNYVLLCNQCHQEAPNVNDSKHMFEWIKRTKVSFYDSYWRCRELAEELRNLFNQTSVHFGHGNKINESTENWLLTKAQKTIEKYFPSVNPDNHNNIIEMDKAGATNFLMQTLEIDKFIRNEK